MAGRVLIVPSSQADSCAQAVRAFLYPIGPRVHAVQAKLAKPDGVVCNTALWTIGNRELSGIAEEIATWISTEADEPKDMETAITVWDRRIGNLRRCSEAQGLCGLRCENSAHHFSVS